MLQTKALYNLLRLNAAEGETVSAESWALENLRDLSQEELFSRLQKEDVALDPHAFLQFAEQCETPEELADLILPDQLSDDERDPLYLLIFELWRRLLPEKQSLSIFCDELDHRIALYDQHEEEADELIQEGLANLLEVLDENADTGAEPEAVFTAICDYCATDLETFLFDYIANLLDSGNSLYASELIEGFSPYVVEPLWFDFLRVRLLAFTDIGDAEVAMHRLLESDLDLLLLTEMIRFLSKREDSELFSLCIEKILPLLKTQEEFVEVLNATADHYRDIDSDLFGSIQSLIKKQQAPEQAPSPLDLQTLENLLA